MDGKQPESIVTDDQGALGKALRDIKRENNYKWDHLLDRFHKMQALKRLMIKNNICREQRSQLLKCFSILMKEPNPTIFKQQV